MEDVIKVSVMHFEGTAYNGPFAEVKETSPEVIIEETEDFIIYQTGKTKAVIDKRQIPGGFVSWRANGN